MVFKLQVLAVVSRQPDLRSLLLVVVTNCVTHHQS